MNKKKVVLYIFLIFALLCTSVYATISGDISLSASKTTVSPGEELSVTLKITDVTFKGGIDSIEGYINIDENVLEDLTLESIVTNNGKVQIGENSLNVYDSNTDSVLPSKGVFFNTNPSRGEGDCRLVINLNKAVPTDTDLVTLNFRVKNSVNNGTYEKAISYDLFVLFNEDTDKTEKVSKSLDVVVEAKSINEVEGNNNTVNNTTKNEVKNNTVNNTTKKEVKNNTVNNTTKNEVKNTVKNTIKNEVKNTVNNTTKNEVKNNTVNNTTKNEVKNNTVKNTIKNQVKNNTVKNTIKNNTVDNTVSKDRLPDTGYRIIIIPIVLIAILGLVFYSKYNKYNVK